MWNMGRADWDSKQAALLGQFECHNMMGISRSSLCYSMSSLFLVLHTQTVARNESATITLLWQGRYE
jgi:hypothetical protein